MPGESIEHPFFTWDNAVIVEEGCLMYVNCTFKQNIGTYKTGDVVGAISLDCNKSELSVWNGKDADYPDPDTVFDVALVVTERK